MGRFDESGAVCPGELPARLAAGDLDLILTYGFSLYDKPDLVTVNVQNLTRALC